MADKTDFDQLKGDKKIPLKDLFKRVFAYLKPEVKSFVISGLLIILTVVFDVLFPLFIEKMTNILSPKTEAEALSLIFRPLLILVVSYFILTMVGQVFLYFESMILQKAGQRIIYSLRMEVFEHISNMSQNQFDEMPVGSLVTRVTNYTTSMSDFFTNTIVSLIRNILTVVAVFAIMIIKSWILSLVLLSLVIVIFIVSFFFSKEVKKIFKKERMLVSDLNSFLNENLSGMKITQIFNQEKRKENEFEEKNEKIRKTRFGIIVLFGIYRPFISLLYHGAIAITFFGGLKLSLLPGTILAFYLYLSKFFNPIQNIADQLNNIQRATTACERLFNLLDVEPEVIDEPDAISIDHFKGEIEFKNVWFAYKGEDWILKDVSFKIEAGQTVAFVGATGAGKTTILGLIVRNYEIQKGQILIDGIDTKHIKIKSLRNCIGQMLQDVFLFTGNVRDNITLHETSYTDDEINAVCKYVNADTFINRDEKGLDQEVIERGENYSQGQRQLLSFARTVLHKPQILILDEATANIDTETEVLIQQSLENIKNIGTMLVVAHRLSTIQKADQIFVLQKGEIIEHGNHQSLLKQKGYYHKLYEVQFANK